MTTVQDAPAAPSVGGVEPETGKRRSRRRWLAWPALGAVLIAGGAGAWLWATSGSTESTSTPAGPVATATVERATISATETWDGTLGHGTPFTVTSGADGTITRRAEQGQAVERGTTLYRIDERPVVLLYGAVPAFRNLAIGDTGSDVEQLEANLTALGYGGFTADAHYDASTAQAVRDWQTDIGAEPTGSVARGDVVFAPEAGRVDALHVKIGDSARPGMPILDITGSEEVASLEIDIDDQDQVPVGTQVTVVLLSRDEIPGTVTASTLVQRPDVPDGTDGGDSTEAGAIAAVEIALADDVDDSLVGAPVDVIVAIDERPDVLVVPVNALLALAEGGYGLEVVDDDGATEIVPIDTGLFADGKVEISGTGIRQGTVVGTAGR